MSVRAPTCRHLGGALVAALGLFGLTSCGPDLPPTLPSTDVHARFASRIDLVDMVIADRARAEKVTKVYAEIERLMLTIKRTSAGEIAKLGFADPPHSDAEALVDMAKVRDADIAGFRRYVELQMEVRKLVTAEEFAKLDAIK